MSLRFFFILSIALVLATGSAWMAYQWISDPGKKRANPGHTAIPVRSVVVAADNISFGTKLELSQLKKIEWPSSSIPSEAFQEINQLIGRIATRRFIKNEIFLQQNVREYLGGSTLSALIAKGMRAISVRVNDVVGVAGFILPGNTVDIVASQKKGKTHTLLHNIKVLAVDQEASPDKEKPAVVRALTLEVTPIQAEVLVTASQKGTLQFTLRNPTDQSVTRKSNRTVYTKQPRHMVKKFSWKTNKLSSCNGTYC